MASHCEVFTPSVKALISKLNCSKRGKSWRCKCCPEKFNDSASLLTHMFTNIECSGGLRAEDYGVAECIVVLAAVDYCGMKEVVESYVHLWETNQLDEDEPTFTAEHGFALQAPSYLSDLEKAEYTRIIANVIIMSEHRAKYLKPNTNYVSRSAKLLEDWNSRTYGKRVVYRTYESWSSRRCHDIQRIKELLDIKPPQPYLDIALSSDCDALMEPVPISPPGAKDMEIDSEICDGDDDV